MPEWKNGCWNSGPDEVVAINAPVTISDLDRGGRDGRREIDLREYTDYVLRKYDREKDEAELGGEWPSGGGRDSPGYRSIAFAARNANSDTPLRAVGATAVDAQFVFSAGVVCNKSDGTAGSITMTVTYYDVTAGASVVTLTHALTATGSNNSGPTVVNLLAGSTVTVSVAVTGIYATATYDAFVGFHRQA